MARIEEIGSVGASGRAANLGTSVLLGLLLLAAIGFVYTGIDRVNSHEAAVVINNLTGSQNAVTRVGYIIHLPFGLSEVYKFSIVDRSLSMQGDNAVVVKTADGSNINVDVQVKYRARRDDESLKLLARNFGRDSQLAQVDLLVSSFVRACVREALGKLHVQEVTEGTERQAKAREVSDALNARLGVFGVSIDTVSIPRPSLQPEYQALIDQRKDADNVLINQTEAQAEALQRQTEQIAEATRQWHTAVEEEKGRQEKRLIDARGLAKQKQARADGLASRSRIDGDKAYQVAQDEAKAVQSEGLAKATGISKLAEAYDLGGIALVREALAAKYLGTTVKGQPYDFSGMVERLALEPGVAAGATATSAPANGGRK